MKRVTIYPGFAVALVVCLGAAAQPPELAGQTIGEVRLSGLERISEQVVRAQLEAQAGQAYSPRAVARDLRRLYELGYFSTIQADANVEAGKVILTYIFEEKRIINELRIVGSDKVRPRHVRAALSWHEGGTFDEQGYSDERQSVLELYESKGFPNATVDFVVEEAGPGRVNVTCAVDEGRKARIRQIRFDGNTVLSRRKLKKLVKTDRAWWFLGGKYEESQFEIDLESILTEYKNYGRLEVDIPKVDFAYDDSGKRMDITIHIAEGPEYSVAALDTSGNAVFDDDEVLGLLEVQAGDVHNVGQVDEDAQLVQKGYADSGFVNAVVNPQVTLDREAKTTNIIHRIQEGELMYVGEIKITGNTVTQDDVVRRELLLYPGERFDGTMLRASERRLDNTEYFDSVRFTREPIAGDELFENLLVDVDEGKTGNFDFGLGYSTEEKFGVYSELRLRNFDIANWPTFSGAGQQLRLRLNVGELRNQYYLAFTDPEIFGYPLAFGFDVFDESREYESGYNYEETNQGAQLRLAKQLSPYVTARTALRYSDIDIDDVGFVLNPELRKWGGDVTSSTLWGINRNTVDRRFDPSRGSEHDLGLELAGLGGDNEFYRIDHDSIWYVPVDKDEKWIFSFRTREGWANDYGDPGYVPIQFRYFAGGSSTVRGYDYREIGPTEKRFTFFGDDYYVGGELRLVQNAEIKYKITENLRVYSFLDAGGVWRSASDFDIGDMKYSIGLGLGFNIPRLGPIRVDYGFPLNPDEDQGSGRLHLQTGLKF
ncbi:MAG TPA: outer membrane protein assembly factor BamA [Candidatus Hydrogenedentes bacterium]|nr:outer membrane protein assembly factor BamA [Candidatus Hydrogenedentota bacterium]HQH53684.1 outer membrane protein assembly factor BamA [Candidatus Hydrogenedentota bacterium]HQM50015.1 outer membrane protein assembly factor BamA [Candidatus Hydrogenedentota bacterium]